MTHVVNSYIQGTPIGTIRKYISIDTYAEFQQRINWRAEGGLTDNRDSCKLAQKVYATGSVPGKIEVIATMTTKIRSHIFMAEFSWMNGQWKATYMRIL